jgi:hypothetical protein
MVGVPSARQWIAAALTSAASGDVKSNLLTVRKYAASFIHLFTLCVAV